MKNKNMYKILSIILVCIIVSFVLFTMPISRQTTKHEDIYIESKDNGYRIVHSIKIKTTNEIIAITEKDIEVQYVEGYVSKNGTKAHLEEYKIKSLIGNRIKYKLIITQSVS